MDRSLLAALHASPLGAGLTLPELTAVSGRLDVVDLDPGQPLFAAGAEADAAYVVLQGEVEIHAPDGTFLDREGPGALVGEQALLPEGPGTRNAAIRATEPTRLLRLEAALFAALATARADRQRQVEAASDAKTRNRLGRLSGPFGRLLAESERRTWEEGQVLFEEGDVADGLHLVLAGRAEVLTVREGEPVHLTTLYPGRIFGEIATLRGGPRTATVVARAGLRTAFVPAGKVGALQAEHPDLAAFLASLLRTYALPRRGVLHQRSVLVGGRLCIETTFALDDGRSLTALREPEGRYRLTTEGATVARELALAEGTVVSLDAEHRVVGLEDAGAYADVAGLQALALDGVPLSVAQRRAFRKAAREAALQAPDALICRCLGLERAPLQAAIDAGADTTAALQAATGCGTVCGACMREAVPAMVAAGPAAPAPAAPALPAVAATPVPRMPHLIPWLGNFSFSRDPAGFQRRGHARLGPVFAAHLMGVDFVFVDPAARPDLVAGVLAAPPAELDAAAAWEVLAGDRLGAERVAARPELAPAALPAAARAGLAAALAEGVAAGGPVDLVALAGAAVTAALLGRSPGAVAPEVVAEVAPLLACLDEDLSAFGALLPLETPAARRRAAARRALEARLGSEALAPLVAVHRNASLAVVAGLLDLLADAEALAWVRQGGEEAAACALAEAIGPRSGGAVWRRALRPVTLAGGTVPAGALVGTLMALAAGPEGARQVVAGGRGALFDEAFGTRGPGGGLAEVVAAAVLSHLVARWDWTVVEAPGRWTPPIVPGMDQPHGRVRGIAVVR